MLPDTRGHVPPCCQQRSRYLTISAKPLPAPIRGRRPRPSCAASWSSPRATLRARWRCRPGRHTSTTGWCSPPGARARRPGDPGDTRERRSVPGRQADRGFRPVTIGRRAAAIAAAHRAQDHPNPCDSGAVAAVMSGIRREHGTRPLRRAAPLELDPLARLLEPVDASTLAGRRDRAMLLLGFAAALRRSELIALDVEDLEFDAGRGLKIVIRSSKTDQERAGAQGRRPYARTRDRCAVRALQAWLAARRHPPGPGVPTVAPWRQAYRPAPLRPVRCADHQTPGPGRRPPPHVPLRALPARRLRDRRSGRRRRGTQDRQRHPPQEPPCPTQLHPRRDRVRRRRRSPLNCARHGRRPGEPGTRSQPSAPPPNVRSRR
jgi:hypothetical protein